MAGAHITRKILSKEVSWRGTDFRGSESVITFSPTKNGERGWWWNTGREIVPIDHKILRLRRRHLVLVHGKQKLRIYEHLGSLRFLGFDSIVVTCPSGWPPYDGRPFEAWKLLEPHVREDGHIPFKGINVHGMGSNGLGFTFFTQVTDRSTGELSVRIDVDYKGVGKKSLAWNSSKQDMLIECLRAPAPVYPAWIRYPAGMFEKLGWWKHSRRVSWPHLTEPDAWLTNAVQHRLCDALGAFSLFFHEELPSGFIHSDKAGHACDFRAIEKCFEEGSRGC